MRTEFFSFGGLDVLTTRRLLDGFLTIVEIPCQVGGPSEAVAKDMMRIARTLALPGRSPSPTVCFLGSGSTLGSRPDSTALRCSRKASEAFLALPKSALRLAVIEPGCIAIATLLAHHVIFARRGDVFPDGSFDFPGAATAIARRVGDRKLSEGSVTAEDLHQAGLVDVLFEGDPEEIVTQYVVRNDRRRNGELGIHEAIRLIPRTSEPSGDAEISSWLERRLRLVPSELAIA